MENRRQAFKREPVEVELAPGDVIYIAPVPWEQRNLFADEVVRQNVAILNEAVKIYVDEDTGVPQLEAKLTQKFTDPNKLFELGLLPETLAMLKTQNLYYNQVVEILLAIVDVNDLTQLKPMIDPNSLTPTPLSGILLDLVTPGTDSPKIESGPDSSSPDSEETSSEDSPTRSAVPS
jgi:hypothetical protein